MKRIQKLKSNYGAMDLPIINTKNSFNFRSNNQMVGVESNKTTPKAEFYKCKASFIHTYSNRILIGGSFLYR